MSMMMMMMMMIYYKLSVLLFVVTITLKINWTCLLGIQPQYTNITCRHTTELISQTISVFR